MTWMKLAKIDVKKCNLFEDLTEDRPEWWDHIHLAELDIVGTKLWYGGDDWIRIDLTCTLPM